MPIREIYPAMMNRIPAVMAGIKLLNSHKYFNRKYLSFRASLQFNMGPSYLVLEVNKEVNTLK
jgi:hypothetical protein